MTMTHRSVAVATVASNAPLPRPHMSSWRLLSSLSMQSAMDIGRPLSSLSPLGHARHIQRPSSTTKPANDSQYNINSSSSSRSISNSSSSSNMEAALNHDMQSPLMAVPSGIFISSSDLARAITPSINVPWNRTSDTNSSHVETLIDRLRGHDTCNLDVCKEAKQPLSAQPPAELLDVLKGLQMSLDSRTAGESSGKNEENKRDVMSSTRTSAVTSIVTVTPDNTTLKDSSTMGSDEVLSTIPRRPRNGAIEKYSSLTKIDSLAKHIDHIFSWGRVPGNVLYEVIRNCGYSRLDATMEERVKLLRCIREGVNATGLHFGPGHWARFLSVYLKCASDDDTWIPRFSKMLNADGISCILHNALYFNVCRWSVHRGYGVSAVDALWESLQTTRNAQLVHCFSTLVDICLRFNDDTGLRRFLHYVRDSHDWMTPVIYEHLRNLMPKALSGLDDNDSIKVLFTESFRKKNLPPNKDQVHMYYSRASAAAKRGDIDGALNEWRHLAEDAKSGLLGLRRIAIDFGTFLRVRLPEGHHTTLDHSAQDICEAKLALKKIVDILHSVPEINGADGGRGTFKVVMNVMAHIGDVNGVRDIASIMRKMNIEPCEDTIRSVVSVFGRRYNVEGARAAVTYLVNTDGSDYESALRVIRDAPTLSVLSRLHRETGELDVASDLYVRAVHAGSKTSPMRLLLRLAREGSVNSLVSVIRELKPRHLNINECNDVLEALSNSKSEAANSLGEILDVMIASLRIVPNTSTITTLLSRASPDSAVNILSSAIRGGVERDVGVYNALLLRYERLGLSHMRHVVYLMRQDDVKPDTKTYYLLVRSCARKGDGDSLTSIIHEMVTVDGVFPNSASFAVDLVRLCLQHNNKKSQGAVVAARGLIALKELSMCLPSDLVVSVTSKLPEGSDIAAQLNSSTNIELNKSITNDDKMLSSPIESVVSLADEDDKEMDVSTNCETHAEDVLVQAVKHAKEAARHAAAAAKLLASVTSTCRPGKFERVEM